MSHLASFNCELQQLDRCFETCHANLKLGKYKEVPPCAFCCCSWLPPPTPATPEPLERRSRSRLRREPCTHCSRWTTTRCVWSRFRHSRSAMRRRATLAGLSASATSQRRLW